MVDRCFGLGYNVRKSPRQMDQIVDLVQGQEQFASTGWGEYKHLLPKVVTLLAIDQARSWCLTLTFA
jgi:hypothetical protein